MGRKNKQHSDTKRGQLPPVVLAQPIVALWASELIEYCNLFPTSTSCPTWLNGPHLIFDYLFDQNLQIYVLLLVKDSTTQKSRWTLNDWVIINPQWGMVNLIVNKSLGRNGLWTFWQCIYIYIHIYIYKFPRHTHTHIYIYINNSNINILLKRNMSQ